MILFAILFIYELVILTMLTGNLFCFVSHLFCVLYVATFSITGKMPVPPRVNLRIVGWASCQYS
jgi:uncharacterized SAM-binding protein YcdF (DUF218 family)